VIIGAYLGFSFVFFEFHTKLDLQRKKKDRGISDCGFKIKGQESECRISEISWQGIDRGSRAG